MNNRSRKFLFIAFLHFPFILFAGNENQAQGARSASMGNASVCFSDVWSTQNNQAGLAFLKNSSAAFYCENRFLQKELKLAGLSVALPIKKGSFGFIASGYGFSVYKEQKFGLSYAKSFGPYFSAGIQLDYLTTTIAEGYGSKESLAGEIGVLAKILSGLTLGLHIHNPTRTAFAKYQDERNPTVFRAGLMYEFSTHILLTAETEKNNHSSAIFKLGIEYSPVKEFFFRAGVSNNPSSVSFGLGISVKNFKLDLATSWYMILGYTPGIGLRYVFNNKSDIKPKTEM